MNVHFKNLFLLLLCFLILPSCFLGGGTDKIGTVKGYKAGVVTTRGGSFKVGVLPPNWVYKKIGYKVILLANTKKHQSISVSSFCGGSFDDSPLPILTNQLFYGLTGVEKETEKNMQLDGRSALRTLVHGQLDGVPVMVDVVVLKKDSCIFDLTYTANPNDYKTGVPDFENFYKGFRYHSGPQL